jgi:hypothetical protein
VPKKEGQFVWTSKTNLHVNILLSAFGKKLIMVFFRELVVARRVLSKILKMSVASRQPS